MSSEWYSTTLGQICKFAAGSAFKVEHQGATSGAHPFIKVSDMNLPGNEIFIRRAQNFVSDELRAAMKAKLHPAGATVFAKIGVALQSNRRRLLVRPTIIDNNMMSATPLAGKTTSRFLYFLLSSLDFNKISAGTALPYLNVSDLQKMEVAIPTDLGLQTQIEQILGPLDDRIALLRETNATLEAIARALFKSWFVDFDPVRAKMEGRVPEGMDEGTAALFPAEFEESELGLVPMGWFATTLGAVTKEYGGSIQTGPFGSQLHASDYTIEGTPVAMPKDLDSRRVSTLSVARVPAEHVVRLARHCLNPGDIVFSRRGDVERHALITKREAGWLCGTGCLLVRPGSHWRWPAYLSMVLDSPAARSWLVQHAIGATMPNLNTGILASVPVVLASAGVLDKFEQVAMELEECRSENLAREETLSRLRDTLLPRLISGQLHVEQATEAMEPA